MELYLGVENFISNTFAIDGKACIQRMICELAEVPIDKRSIWGEILHAFIE